MADLGRSMEGSFGEEGTYRLSRLRSKGLAEIAAQNQREFQLSSRAVYYRLSELLHGDSLSQPRKGNQQCTNQSNGQELFRKKEIRDVRPAAQRAIGRLHNEALIRGLHDPSPSFPPPPPGTRVERRHAGRQAGRPCKRPSEAPRAAGSTRQPRSSAMHAGSAPISPAV